MCNLMSYNVEISNNDFSKAASLLGHMKIIRGGKRFTVIETTRHERSTLTRNGIPFSLIENKDDDE